MNGSASAPSSATMNGTRCAIRPAMNATSRESRSSLATMTGAFACLACASARGELRPALERVGALAGLDLDVLGDQLEALGLANLAIGRSLRLQAEAAPALALVEPEDTQLRGARSAFGGLSQTM